MVFLEIEFELKKILSNLGSHEFYSHRAEITKRLIQEKVLEIFQRIILF
jgi:hypothetical protein